MLLQKDNLRTKGLLSSRGIFEQCVLRCFYELKKTPNEKFVVSNTISKIDEMIRDPSKIPSEAPNTRELIQHVQECKFEYKLQSLFNKLSKEIHGSPWSGECVKVFSKDLNSNEICLIKKISSTFGLDTELTAEEER